MKKVGNKLLSVVLILAMVCSMLWTNGKADTANAAETVQTDGELFFGLRGGVNNYIQVNTNLPSDTPLKNFETKDNDCSIDERKNQHQNVGWIGMNNDGGTIVLTFHFNATFEAGQTYVLPKGAIFGFTDGKKYELDGDYTFTFDGSNWTMSVERPEITRKLTAGYTLYNLVQFDNFYNFGVNASDTPLTFKGQVFLGETEITNPQFVGYPGNTTICLKGLEGHTGQVLTIKAGSEISYLSKTVKISQTFHAKWEGKTWTKVLYQEGERELTAAYTEVNLVQFANFYDFGVPEDNTKLTFEGTVKLDGVKVDNPDFIGYKNNTTICLNIAHGGKTLTIEAGSTLSYDGIEIKISKNFNGTWDGKNWNPIMKGEKELKAGHTQDTLVQFLEFYDFGVPENNTPLKFEGTVKLDGVKVENPDFIGYPNTTTICLQNIDHAGNVLTIVKGSVLSYNGIGVKISKTFNAKWTQNTGWETVDLPESDVEGDANGDLLTDVYDLVYLKKALKDSKLTNNQCDLDGNGKYTETDVRYLRLILAYGSMQNVDLLAEARFAGGEDFITFADLPVDSRDPEKIAEYKDLGFNTSLLTEDYVGDVMDKMMKVVWEETTPIEVENPLILEPTGVVNGTLIQCKTNLPFEKEYENFLMSAGGVTVYPEESRNTQFVQMLKDDTTVYMSPVLQNSTTAGDKYVLGQGSKFTFNGVVYTLDRTYTFTMTNDYLVSLENLDKAGLNVWIRNYSNKSDYFTESRTNVLTKYKDVIDGFYMADESFMTKALLDTAQQNDHYSDFETMSTTLLPWFQQNFSDKFFHMNHVPISSYDHYEGNSEDATKYGEFLTNYTDTFLKPLGNEAGKSICFDNYPFVRKQTDGFLGIGKKSGIADNYLQNILVAANRAKEYNATTTNGDATFGMCVQTFNAQTTTGDASRDITKSEEVSLQLYTGMAMGANLFEYFAYNSQSNMWGIIGLDGQQRIYDKVKEGNKNALCFGKLVSEFDWQGMMTSTGTVKASSTKGFEKVSAMVLNDNTNGVLETITSTHDAVIGYFTQGTQDGYMVANYNDPVAVTNNNEVTLTFAGCTRARVYASKGGKLTSEVVTLTDGMYTCEVAPGSGFFIIPA